MKSKLVFGIAISLTIIGGGEVLQAAPDLNPTTSESHRIGEGTNSLVCTLGEQEKADLLGHIDAMKQMNAKGAKSAVREYGSAAVPTLLQSLDTNEPVQAQQICEVLGRTKDPRALSKRVEVLKSDNSALRFAAIHSIYSIGAFDHKELTPALLACLKDKQKLVRWITIKTLANLNDDRAIPSLIDCLRDGDPELAEEAVAALVKITGATANHSSDWMAWELWYADYQRRKGHQRL